MSQTKHPALPASFFSENRKQLLNNLTSDSLALIQSSEQMVRNSDLIHSWRQDSNFFYLTGIEVPGCSLLLIPDNVGKAEELLFIPPVDPELEKWEGEMLTKEKAKELSGIKTVYTTDAFEVTLYRAQKWREKLYCELNDVFPNQPLTQQHLLLKDISLRLPGLALKKLAPLVSKQRVTKKKVEIEYLKKSISIIKTAFDNIFKKVKPGIREYRLEAELAYHYIANGCSRLGFESIIATGANATTLHYVNNADEIKNNDLVLIDTGGEYGMYSGDITRTFPANGRFTERQAFCYQAVLDIQKTFIKELKPGVSWDELSKKAGEIQGKILTERGIIEKPEDHPKVTLHRIGHFLGLDVHDVGLGSWVLEPGVVVTVEPGLYLKEEGIGIRIEDDFLITETGWENLSSDIPKEIEELEALISK